MGAWFSGNSSCAWSEGVNYDLSAVPATGSMQFQLVTNGMMFKAGTTNKNPGSQKYMSLQLLSQINVMVSAGGGQSAAGVDGKAG